MSRYAEIEDLAVYGLPASWLAGISDADKNKALDSASSMLDDALNSRFELPLVSWGESLKRYACRIAAYELASTRGFSPTDGSDALLRLNYQDALNFMRDFQAHRVNLHGVVDSSEDTDEGGPFVDSDTSRNWSRF